MPAVTALKALKRGRIAVEVDGEAWRVLPADVVVRAGVAVGAELDRPRLRDVRRALRRQEALEHAARALRYRDLSSHRLGERLERRGTPPRTRQEAVGVLTSSGLVDDRRLARLRAESLAARGMGDAAIRFDLERQGVPSSLVTEALAEVDPEPERARRMVDAHGPGLRTARLLARRGFDEATIAGLCDLDVFGF